MTELTEGEVTQRWPQVLAGGKAILFTANAGGPDGRSIDVESLVDHRRKTLIKGGTFGRFLRSGHLVYVRDGTLFAVPFDLEKLEVRGTPTPMLDQVDYTAQNGAAQFDFSGNGTFVYQSGGAQPGGALVSLAWVDAEGKTQPLLAKPGVYGRPNLSPDGQRVALDVAEGSASDIWIYEWQRDTMTRLTFTGTSQAPMWSPDGRYVAFREVGAGMSAIRSDGSGKAQLLVQSKNAQYPWSFTPDGKRLAYFGQSAGTSWDLWTLPLESDGTTLRGGKPEVFLQTPASERTPAISPDGRWVAYASNESGTFQVYVRGLKGGRWQVSNGGAFLPVWSRTGRELFFETTNDDRIMVAIYAAKGDLFVADKPRLWSDKRLGGGANGERNFDLAPDGKRIVALFPADGKESQQTQSHVIFLENFFDELKRKVPVGK